MWALNCTGKTVSAGAMIFYGENRMKREEHLNIYLTARNLIGEKARETKMENVEITVKVNGRDVPIETVSTETFEKVKEAASEPKHKGVLVGNCYNAEPRVFFKVTDDICERRGKAVALDTNGCVVDVDCTLGKLVAFTGFDNDDKLYGNIKKLGD